MLAAVPLAPWPRKQAGTHARSVALSWGVRMGPWWSRRVMADAADRSPSSIPTSTPRGRPFVARSGPPSRPPLQPRDARALGAGRRAAGRRSAGWPEPARERGGPDQEPTPTPTPTATPSPPATPVPTPPGPTSRPSSATVTFYGRGYGHGVGMSQYGARGRALEGQDAPDDPRPLLPGRRPSARSIPRRRSASWSSADLKVDARPSRSSSTAAASTGRIDGHRPASSRRTPTDPDPDHEGDDGRHDDDLARSGVDTDRREAARRVATKSRSSSARVDPERSPPAGLEADRRTTSTGARSGCVPRTTPTSASSTALSLETYLRGVVPAEMPSTLAGGGAPGPGDRVPLVRRAEAATRRVRTTTSVDDSRSQVYRGVEGRARPRTPRSRRPRAGPAQAARPIANAHVPLDRRRRDRAQRERLHVGDRQEGRRAGQLPARLDATGATTVPRTTPQPRTRRGRTRRYSRAQLSAWFAADARTNVGDLIALDLRAPRRLRAGSSSVTLIGSRARRPCRRGLPVGPQRPPAGRRPDAAQHAVRHAPVP